MKLILKQIISVAFVLLTLVSFTNAAGIGKVIVSVGQVEAVDSEGAKRDLKRRSAVFATDTVATYSGAKTQLRFTDGSMVSLAQNSLFKIEEYEFGGSSGEKAVYNLIKGGLQTITGAIGHTNKQDYTLKTPVATIGIRGTFYQVFLTPGGGLVGFVKEGGIVVENAKGETISIKPGQYFSMDSATGDVSITDTPPEEFSKAEKENATEKEGENEDKDGETVELEDGTVTITEESDDGAGVNTNPGSFDPVAGGGTGTGQSNIPIVGTKAPTGSGFGVAFIIDEATADSYVVDASHQLYIDTVDGVGNVPTYIKVGADEFASNNGVLTNTGGNGIGVNWGRWTGGFIAAENGVQQTVVGPDFHYIYTDKLTPYATLASSLSGYTGNFTLNGGTTPTSSDGSSVNLYDFTVGVDFSSMEFTSVNIEVQGGVNIIGSLVSNTPISTSLTTNLVLDKGSTDVQIIGQNPVSNIGIGATYKLTESGKSVVGAAFLNGSLSCEC